MGSVRVHEDLRSGREEDWCREGSRLQIKFQWSSSRFRYRKYQNEGMDGCNGGYVGVMGI